MTRRPTSLGTKYFVFRHHQATMVNTGSLSYDILNFKCTSWDHYFGDFFLPEGILLFDF